MTTFLHSLAFIAGCAGGTTLIMLARYRITDHIAARRVKPVATIYTPDFRQIREGDEHAA